MDKNIESVLEFEGYSIDSIKYIKHEDFNDNKSVELDFSLQVEISITQDPPFRGNVSLKINIFENAAENNYPFSLETSITGKFNVADNAVEKEEFFNLCKHNGTTILFPFLRSVVADITRTSNVEPLILPLINVNSFLKEKYESEVNITG